MSVHAISWVLKHSTAEKGDRLVLIVLADHASNDGTDAYPAVATIAHEARMSERAVQYALRRLERDGHISSEGPVDRGRGDRQPTRYTVLMGGADSAPRGADGVQTTTSRGANGDGHGVQGIAPEPSLEPPSNRKTEGHPHRRVSRKVVTKEEWELAGQIIEVFNEVAGTRLTLEANYVPIIGRIREKPQYELRHHRKIIERNFARPWWHGPPGVQVIYGNAAQFESSIEVARGQGRHKESEEERQRRRERETSERYKRAEGWVGE